jgi:hypothetical protein
MMMSDKKKGMATIILSKMGKPSEEMSEVPKNDIGDELDQSAGKDAAAEEILQAVESKDPKALKSALQSMIDMCMNESEDEE